MGTLTFGDVLREFRVRAGLSQSDLAEKAHISEAAVGALERGIRKTPYRNTVALLSKALGLTPQESVALANARSTARIGSATGIAHNLQTKRTSFVGRDANVEYVLKLLRRSRLVTITGSGGVGKTRVAMEAARQMLGDLWNEAWFVDLASLTDGNFVVAKIASSIRPPLARVDAVVTLATALTKRQMLLILDNCEHVIDHAAEVADAILERCPKVNILATSRERIDVAGEFVYRLVLQ